MRWTGRRSVIKAFGLDNPNIDFSELCDRVANNSAVSRQNFCSDVTNT